MVNPKSLYVTVDLEEDWVWKDYPLIMGSKGSLVSSNHMVYQRRNLENSE